MIHRNMYTTAIHGNWTVYHQPVYPLASTSFPPQFQPRFAEGSANVQRENAKRQPPPQGSPSPHLQHQQQVHVDVGVRPEKSKQQQQAVLFVGQIPMGMNTERLRELFQGFGEVENVIVHKERKDDDDMAFMQPGAQEKNERKQMGSAFIIYKDSDSADCAIYTLHNRYAICEKTPIQVAYSERSPVISAYGLNSRDAARKKKEKKERRRNQGKAGSGKGTT